VPERSEGTGPDRHMAPRRRRRRCATTESTNAPFQHADSDVSTSALLDSVATKPTVIFGWLAKCDAAWSFASFEEHTARGAKQNHLPVESARGLGEIERDGAALR